MLYANNIVTGTTNIIIKMQPSEITNSIYSYAFQAGYKVKIVSSAHLKELDDELALRNRTGDFDDVFYRQRLTSFRYTPTTVFSENKSIIIIAIPQPKVVLIFRWQGEDCSVHIPPTYDTSINDKVQNKLEDILAPRGFKIEPTVLPLKLLTVRSGLAEYGRNNICYIPGEGSFDLAKPSPPVSFRNNLII